MAVSGIAYSVVRRARAISGISRAKNYRVLEVAVVLLLPDEAAHAVQRQRFDILRRIGSCAEIEAPPHVTLKMGFKTSDVEAVAARVREICARVPPVDLQVSGFGQFEEGILFLDVKESAGFEALRQSMLGAMVELAHVEPCPVEVSGFHPHVTLVRDLSGRRLEIEAARFAGVAAELQFTADRVAVIVGVDDRWATYMSCRLGSGGGQCNPKRVVS